MSWSRVSNLHPCYGTVVATPSAGALWTQSQKESWRAAKGVGERAAAKKDRLTLGSVFPPCSVFQLCLPQREMSCCRPCVPSPCGASGPTPLASSCSEPCVARCADSTVAIQASPVVVTLPGPILTSFPQSTAVGSSLSAAVGSSLSTAGVPISSGGSLGLGGSGLCLPRPPCSFNC